MDINEIRSKVDAMMPEVMAELACWSATPRARSPASRPSPSTPRARRSSTC